MSQWLLQRQPGLVARLRVDTGPTGALQPSSAALERRTLRVGVTLAAALTALQSITHLINVVAFDLSGRVCKFVRGQGGCWDQALGSAR